MFERGAALRTWACAGVPAIGQELLADELAVHRLDYLDYEGEVPGNRGSVERVAAGDYEELSESADQFRVRLTSEQLSGELTLARDPDMPNRWRVRLSNPST